VELVRENLTSKSVRKKEAMAAAAADEEEEEDGGKHLDDGLKQVLLSNLILARGDLLKHLGKHSSKVPAAQRHACDARDDSADAHDAAAAATAAHSLCDSLQLAQAHEVHADEDAQIQSLCLALVPIPHRALQTASHNGETVSPRARGGTWCCMRTHSLFISPKFWIRKSTLIQQGVTFFQSGSAR
jgi:hypothetical protein